MARKTYKFQPDYAVPPGWVLEERLEANGISQAEFARRCGRSAKFISDIIAGKAPVDAKTALQFEKVSGVSANIWLGIEKRFRLHLMREAEAREAEESAEWARGFPVSELVKRGAIHSVTSA
ncbi:MAG: helix-turn-helix domain-containing protein, partial [Nitrospinae bacterium]|nr:helix-turn-helix domain-containing protein [Nitrospinota bacterium]